MKKLETTGQRIRALRLKKKLTQGKLAKIAGVSGPNVTSWEKDAYLPKAGALDRLANFFGVSTNYLLNGGDMGVTLDNNVMPISAKLLPVLSWVQAGKMTAMSSVEPRDVMEWQPPLSIDDPENCFYLRVVGVSNSPTYIEGDLILVDPNFQVSDLSSGLLVVVRNNTDATFKKLVIESDGTKYLEALNPEWKPKIINFEEGMELVGVVIDATRPLGGSRPKRVRKH